MLTVQIPRAYFVIPYKAGVTAEEVNILHGVLGDLSFFAQSDPESRCKPALSRCGNGHGTALSHPLGPAEIEEAPSERGADRAGNVWPSLGPIQAYPAEVAAGCTQRSEINAKLRKKPSARLCDFRRFVAEHDVFVSGEEIGNVNAQTASKMIIANPGRTEFPCLS